MERFVQLVVVGGATLVAGLWLAALTTRWSAPWFGGLGLAVVGGVTQAAGVRSELDL